MRAESDYLKTAAVGFSSSSQSINDLLGGFQVAGVKVEAVDKLKEASSEALNSGYFVALDDLEKTRAAIDASRTNILFNKEELSKLDPPPQFHDLNMSLLNFYDEAAAILSAMDKEHKFAKDFLIAVGPNFYIPTLSIESIWQEGKNQEIIEYYKKIKEDAQKALSALYLLSAPDNSQEYFKTQIAYFELLVKTADSIAAILSEAPDTNLENATQIEKAYQFLGSARRENEVISQKLLSQRLKLFSKDENLEKLRSVTVRQKAIEVKFDLIYANQPQYNQTQLLDYLSNFNPFSILGGLQKLNVF